MSILRTEKNSSGETWSIPRPRPVLLEKTLAVFRTDVRAGLFCWPILIIGEVPLVFPCQEFNEKLFK